MRDTWRAVGRYDIEMLDTNLQHSADAWLRDARSRIDRSDADYLLMHATGQSRTWLHAHGDETLSADAGARFAALVERRVAGEPVAYLVGTRGFWTFEVAVTTDTLIPRPETELLLELALARIGSAAPVRVADLGTGSGVLACAIARERPLAIVLATDRSVAALNVARSNAATLGASNVTFAIGDWWQAVQQQQFDVVVSNPPYICDADPHLQQGDLRHEPMAALASGADGLDAIRTIVSSAGSHLNAGGWLLIEHGWQQARDARAVFERAGFVDISTVQDLEHRDRVTSARWA